MKYLVLLIIVTLYNSRALHGQGQFASASWKSIIGKTCKTENDFPALKDYLALGGTLITDVNDDERKSVELFSKGSTVVALFELTTPDNVIHIIDVVEIANVLKTQEVKVGDCQDGENEDSRIIALVNQTGEERWKAVKAWLFNVDKIRVEVWPYQNVSCWGMVGED